MSTFQFTCIEGHTEGMPVRMIIDGAPVLRGASLAEYREHFMAEFDWVRRALVLEPRGHAHMSGTLLYPPCHPEADMGLLFIETSGCLPMCGHATLGSVAFAIEHGLVSPRVPGELVVEVPAGLIRARYRMDGDHVASVRFTNVPSFLALRDVTVHLPALGDLTFDIAYGGNFYPIIERQPNYPGCEYFSPDQLLAWGREIQQRVNQQFEVRHPGYPHIHGVRHCMWTGSPQASFAHGRSVVVAGDSLVDRSPCGTGTSARVAQRFARGLLDREGEFIHESLIGSRFTGRVEEETVLADGTPAVYPSIEGRAFVYGHSTYSVDRSQPYGEGFSLSEFVQCRLQSEKQ